VPQINSHDDFINTLEIDAIYDVSAPSYSFEPAEPNPGPVSMMKINVTNVG
jgi:hypothetical protein